MKEGMRPYWVLLALLISAVSASARQTTTAVGRDLALARDQTGAPVVLASAGPEWELDAEDFRSQDEEAQDSEQERKDQEQEARDRVQEQKDRQNELYQDGAEALDEHHWERAIERFNAAGKQLGARADGALYWKAYAQNKLGRRPDALATLAELYKSYPRSRWLNDAKALEVEVRQSTGQPVKPEEESNEDLKLIAINSLMSSDPERALPLLQKFLEGSQPLKLKERALFVLSQNGSARSREILGQIARGKSNPDLQRKALEYLGLFGGKESRQTLADIYASSSDADVKRTILHSFMVGGDRDRLLAAAKSEKDPDLRADAIHQLGVLGAQNELWELYQKESSLEIKHAILQAMFVGGNAERLGEVARTEKNTELRAQAVRNLGLMGGERTGETLVSIYSTDKDSTVRRAIINALFLQGNAQAIINIARKESDPELKRDAVQKLSLMNSKESTDFMMELLNK